ncbi:MAG: tetratricopeptide repeat protein [Candidatus Yanofskybacteria bacterium]|nr:tetratricopeptide repeat protein [Candidatus Yanofskybacteria bacterium]
MFLIIPLAIFLASIFALVWLISRKFVYLKKLSPEVIENSMSNGQGFWSEFFPGFANKFDKDRWQKHKMSFLAEFEKFLRRLRLVSLKIDIFTNKLINRTRRSLIDHEKSVNGSIDSVQTALETKSDLVVIDKAKALKEEEQALIIEIAKNPNDPELYKELGKIYIKTGEMIDAVESFKKALELDPGDDGIRAKLEKAEKRLGKMPT